VTKTVSLTGGRSLLDCAVHRPTSLGELRALREEFPDAELLAGGTWVMRASVRGESVPEHVLALAGIAELRHIELGQDLHIGAMTTLAQIARITHGLADLGALHDAASEAATPALRNMITLGGSIGAEEFTASDIVTALLCLDAVIERTDGVIISASIPRSTRISAHERFTWRSGGEYSVASVSASLDPSSGDIRIALGSVESRPRRWVTVEEALRGTDLSPEAVVSTARNHVSELDSISAPGIPASYRLTVLPEVLSRVVRRLS
jgi:aerobic carbon-monoxide dehydrogenase medium subunit